MGLAGAVGSDYSGASSVPDETGATRTLDSIFLHKESSLDVLRWVAGLCHRLHLCDDLVHERAPATLPPPPYLSVVL